MLIRIFCCLLFLVGVSAAQDSNFAVGPQYLMNYGSALFARPIATPSVAFDSSMSTPEMPVENNVTASENETVSVISDFPPQADLFPIYYGVPRVSVIELSLRQPREQASSVNLPGSFFESGGVQVTDMQSLRLRGYGVTLPEAAAYWKSRHVTTPRVYTNADTERLRPHE
jgi:hypothetical protein